MVRKSLKTFLGFLFISCLVSAQNQTAGVNTVKAAFTLDNNIYDYGNIPEDGGLANHTFTIKNTGDAPLIVKQVVASCGCTTPSWTKDPIASGKTGEIKVAYNPNGRPGPFSKTISVYCENADPVQLTIKGNVEKKSDDNVKTPVFSPVETSHNFGSIGENDGYAEHFFKFKNTGNAPLSITRVQASCGCTKPEWTQTPVEPGQEGVIIITFNPKGRIGNFNKSATVYTNEEGGYKRHKLTITGIVTEKPGENPYITYVDTIGGVGVENNRLIYKTFNASGPNKLATYIKNYNSETVYFSWEDVPDYITVNSPDSLKADWSGEIVVTIDGIKTSDKRGRITDKLVWKVKNKEGQTLGNSNLSATVNYIDNFYKLSPLQSVSAPSLEIKNTQLEFGEVKNGFLGIFGGSASKQLILINNGKSDLIIHSVSSDDLRISLPDLKGKTIKAGESLTVNVTIKAKELESENLDTDIYVICNDPKGPVRLIRVTAQKAK
ncbi:MAG: DUF1573 domain-containing protein [Tannerella sp.]|jgi:hypothetical protein|nr:DUF1573 domain-containing protein [Tannerella sp.]